MALPFSQSMRSLQADRGIPAAVWLGVTLALFLLWAFWFFWAPVTRYETGTVVGTTRDGRLVAEFPSHAYQAIWQGQAAYIRPHRHAGGQSADTALPLAQESSAAIPAVVANILAPPTDEQFRISLSIPPDIDPVALLGQNPAGEVVVEVERISPARLVARASGQLVDSPALSFSPQ